MENPTLVCQVLPRWPKLAWAATLDLDSGKLQVLHGPCVEIHEQWCAEMVWPGDFEAGDFDRLDCVIGSGIRLRDSAVHFVTSADTVNRLHYSQCGRTLHVSNSLPALLARAGIELVEDFEYAETLHGIRAGIDHVHIEIPAQPVPVRVLHLHNLVVDEGRIRVVPKPVTSDGFGDFQAYSDFLHGRGAAIVENAGAPGRRHSVSQLASCSSGYDSTAAALLAWRSGVRQAVALSRARRQPDLLFRIDDSGAGVARRIGLECTVYNRLRANYPWEDAIWSVIGNVGDANLTVFDYPGPVTVLWCGFFGDSAWGPGVEGAPLLERTDGGSGIRFLEARLELGVLLCNPPLWAPLREKDIQALYHREEMAPWRLGGDYDRPVPRRLLEEAGIPRGSFATRKKASTFNRRHGYPLSRNLRRDFRSWQSRRGQRPVNWLTANLSLCLRAFDSLVLMRLPARLRFSCRDWIELPTPNDFFLWSVQRRVERFRNSL